MLVIFVLLPGGGMWCQQQSHAAGKPLKSLVIVGGAKNVKQSKLAGPREQLSYSIQAEYPANRVLETIKRTLKELGWTPLAEDFLNPGLPSSHVRGWDYYEDQTTHPNTSVRVWQADWQNTQHEVVTYRLEYRCPENLCASTRDLRDLHVIAIYIPAKLADRMKSLTAGRSKSNK